MKRISIIIDDDIERLTVRTYRRDFPGAETFDVGSDHSLTVDDGDTFDLRIDGDSACFEDKEKEQE